MNADIERSTGGHMVQGEHSPIEVLKFAALIGGIFLISVILTSSGQVSTTEWLRWFMAVFFIVFAAFKFVGYKMFPLMFASYDIVAKRFKPYAYAFPFIELSLGILYVCDALPTIRDAFTLLIMAVSTVGVWQEVKRRSGVHCACLGNVIKLPLSTTSLVEDVGMGLMALAMLLV